MEVEVLQTGDLLLCPPAHEADGAGRFDGPVRPEAHKGQVFIHFRRGLRPGQHVDLVIDAVLFLDLFAVVEPVKRPIFETVPSLLPLRLLENIRQGVAEVHGSDFLALGGPDLQLMPRPVVAHTAADGQTLFFQINVLPCQRTDLANPKPGVVGDLDGEKRGVILGFQKIGQALILLMGDGRDRALLIGPALKQVVVIALGPADHILHGIKSNQALGKDREAEGILKDGRVQPDIPNTQRLCRCTVGICAAETQQVHIGLQMVGGDGFQLALADGMLLDPADGGLIGHDRSVAQRTGL